MNYRSECTFINCSLYTILLYLLFCFTTFSLIIYLIEIWHHTTNDPLDKLHKKRFYPDWFISLQSTLKEAENEAKIKVPDEGGNLSDATIKLSSELSITKKVLTLYCQADYLPWSENAGQTLSIQQGMLGYCRYSSWSFREVLELKILGIFVKLSGSTFRGHIESCHCINKKSDTVIVSFLDEKTANKFGRIENNEKLLFTW